MISRNVNNLEIIAMLVPSNDMVESIAGGDGAPVAPSELRVAESMVAEANKVDSPESERESGVVPEVTMTTHKRNNKQKKLNITFLSASYDQLTRSGKIMNNFANTYNCCHLNL